MGSSKRIVCTLFSVLLLVGTCAACGPKNDDNEKPQPKPEADNAPKSAVKNMLGDGVKTSPDDSSGFDGKNGQANSPADLKCDFSAPCCWKNSKPPFDTYDWAKASGNVDADKSQKNFGTSSTPSGNFLMTSSDTKAGPADKAEYQSCLIPCAADSIKVTVKHWQSSPTKLQVCQVAQSDPNTLLGCTDLPATGPGPDTVTLPPGQNVYIAIIAYNLVASGGNVAIIQDITVDYPPCSSSSAPETSASTLGAGVDPVTSASTPGGGLDPAECKKIACNFDQDTCGYTPSPGGAAFQQAGPERFRNPATGVDKSPDKSRFLASYLKPGEKAEIQGVGKVFNEARTIKFQEYKATEGIVLKACCDSTEGCNYETGKKVDKNDFRQWYQGSVSCKAGTEKVIFVAENQGKNEGGVGIDNIQVFDASGKQVC